jgi:carbon-monoxide dehydrogenase large subunit
VETGEGASVSILGNRVLRKEDPKFLTVGGSYVDDLVIEGAAYLVYVRSTQAHARITGIDAAAAKQAPGVLDVVTADDLGLSPAPPSMPMINQAMGQPALSTGVVRYVGEPVAAVVAETLAQAADAAEMVVVDYEPLPVVVDPERSVAGETLLFPEAGTNVALDLSGERDQGLFQGCEVVVRQRIVNQRLAPCPLEVRASAARFEPNGRLTFWASTQAPFAVRSGLAAMLGIGQDQIQVLSPDVGGGFGAKGSPYPEELFVAVVARHLGRPVRWAETRSESMMALGHGRAQVQHVELGGSRGGHLQAYRLEVVQDCGAYPILGTILPTLTRTMMCGTYAIPKVEFDGRSVVTNTTPVTSYRGAGRPEATAAIERAIDLFAAEIGMDPAEVRRRNLVAADAFPYTTTVGTTYDVGNYPRALELVLEAADYQSLRAEQARRRQAGERLQLGLGLSVYVEITNGIPGSEYGSVEIFPDGHVLVRTGTSPHGQGHATAWSMLVSEATGIPIEDIEVVHGDTDVVPRGIGTFGSRSLQIGGVAAAQAAAKVVDLARQLAAELLEADPADVVLDRVGQRFHVAGAPARSRSWTDLAREAKERGQSLLAEVDFTPPGPTYPFGAHLAVVEVDVETGRVRLVRMVAVDDAGRILNPLLAEGQVHGGIAQGVAQALLEEMAYDADGNPLTSNLADYSFISAAELPSYETVHMETPTPINELGAKGIGESGTIGSTPAVQNAVVDALSHLGVRHVDMPTTAERVWQALSAARR